jgi:hypothetical protein
MRESILSVITSCTSPFGCDHHIIVIPGMDSSEGLHFWWRGLLDVPTGHFADFSNSGEFNIFAKMLYRQENFPQIHCQFCSDSCLQLGLPDCPELQ